MKTLDFISSIFIVTDKGIVDISNMVTKVDITEDIFSPYVMGELMIEDAPSSPFVSNFSPDGLVGKGEELKFMYVGKIGQFLQEIQGFHIYKIETIVPDDPNSIKQKTSYRICFASKIFFTNEIIKLNRYDEDKFSSIVKRIGEKNLQIKMEVVEETNKKQAIVFPAVTPIEAIMMCAARSVSKDNPSDANYVFYGDIDHKYYFRSIGSLLAQKAVIGTSDLDGLSITTSFGTNDAMSGNLNNSSTKYNVIRYQIKPIMPIKDMLNGMFSSSLLQYDITKRKYKNTTYNYVDNFKKERHLVKYPILTNGPDYISLSYLNPRAFEDYQITSQWVYDANESGISPSAAANSGSEYILKRKSQLQQINQMGLEIEIYGNAEIKLGQTVFFGRPSIDLAGVNSDAKRNPYVTGKYLITRRTTKIENNITTGSHGFILKTVLSLRKDSDFGIDAYGSEGD